MQFSVHAQGPGEPGEFAEGGSPGRLAVWPYGYFAGMAGPGQLTARYDEWADWYEDYVTGEARGFTERAGRALDTVLGLGTGPVLNLACGTGVHAARLRSLGWTPLGLLTRSAPAGRPSRPKPGPAAHRSR